MIQSVKASETIAKAETPVTAVSRALNRIAINDLKSDKVTFTYPKATPEDLKLLTSQTLKDSYKRVTWTNPKDNKVYHILETGREEGLVNVRILDSEGGFVKEAQLKPKTVVMFDQFETLPSPRNMLKFNFTPNITHGEIVETFLRRNNPFVNIERISHKNLLDLIRYRGRLPINLAIQRLAELDKRIGEGHNVDYLSITEAAVVDTGDVKGGRNQKELIKNFGFTGESRGLDEVLSSIAGRGTRVLAAAGNEPKNPEERVNIMLAVDGVEGVGSLVNKDKEHITVGRDSASRSSTFTPHYEQRNYRGRIVADGNEILGINITGKDGVDLPYNRKTKSLLRDICGTSLSTPVRVAKLALNDMLEGIL